MIATNNFTVKKNSKLRLKEKEIHFLPFMFHSSFAFPSKWMLFLMEEEASTSMKWLFAHLMSRLSLFSIRLIILPAQNWKFRLMSPIKSLVDCIRHTLPPSWVWKIEGHLRPSLWPQRFVYACAYLLCSAVAWRCQCCAVCVINIRFCVYFMQRIDQLNKRRIFGATQYRYMWHITSPHSSVDFICHRG